MTIFHWKSFGSIINFIVNKRQLGTAASLQNQFYNIFFQLLWDKNLFSDFQSSVTETKLIFIMTKVMIWIKNLSDGTMLKHVKSINYSETVFNQEMWYVQDFKSILCRQGCRLIIISNVVKEMVNTIKLHFNRTV